MNLYDVWRTDKKQFPKIDHAVWRLAFEKVFELVPKETVPALDKHNIGEYIPRGLPKGVKMAAAFIAYANTIVRSKWNPTVTNGILPFHRIEKKLKLKSDKQKRESIAATVSFYAVLLMCLYGHSGNVRQIDARDTLIGEYYRFTKSGERKDISDGQLKNELTERFGYWLSKINDAMPKDGRVPKADIAALVGGCIDAGELRDVVEFVGERTNSEALKGELAAVMAHYAYLKSVLPMTRGEYGYTKTGRTSIVNCECGALIGGIYSHLVSKTADDWLSGAPLVVYRKRGNE
jgi:hypothetical protein